MRNKSINKLENMLKKKMKTTIFFSLKSIYDTSDIFLLSQLNYNPVRLFILNFIVH